MLLRRCVISMLALRWYQIDFPIFSKPFNFSAQSKACLPDEELRESKLWPCVLMCCKVSFGIEGPGK